MRYSSCTAVRRATNSSGLLPANWKGLTCWCACCVKPFLTQPDSAGRQRSFSTGLLLDWILLALLVVLSRVDFIVFVLFLEAVGVREYCCMAVENRLTALCFVRSSRATHASRATNLRPSGLVALGLAESRQSYIRGVALNREPPMLQQA